MRIIMVLLSGILLVSSEVYADLSVTNLEKISEIVKESVTHEVEKIDIKLTEMEKRLTDKINSLEKQLTIGINAVDTQVGRNFNLILGFIALIVFAVGLPQIITALQGRKLKEHTIIIEDLKQEIELLKQERSV